jgi:iron(III) transport system substrate-binding protein
MPGRRRLRRWTTTLLLAGGIGLAGCAANGPLPGGGAARPPALTLYNGQHPQTTASLVAAFEKATGIPVEERDGDEDQLAAQIATEGAASPADLFYSENSPALQSLQEKGLLAPVDPSTLASVPSRYSSPQGDWVGVSARVSGIVYNTDLVTRSELPSSVMQLAGPAWAGKLGLAPSETDLQPVVDSVALAHGQAATVRWLEGMRSNAGSHVYPDNESLTAAVNGGQVAIAVVDSYYWYRLAYELGASAMHSAFALFAAGDPGYVVDVSGAAVLRSGQQQAAAQRFLAFLVSPPAQEIIAHSQSYEYPLGSGVTTAQPLIPFDQLQPAQASIAQLGDGSTAVSLLREAGLL